MTPVVEAAKVMPKGQITLPKGIRAQLGVEVGDRVVLIAAGDSVVMMNSALFAMRALQNELTGVAAGAGIANEDELSDYLTEMRRQSA